MSSFFFYDIFNVKNKLENITKNFDLDIKINLEKSQLDFQNKLEKYLYILNNFLSSNEITHELFLNMLEYSYVNKEWVPDFQILIDTINKNKDFMDIGLYNYWTEKFLNLKLERFYQNKIKQLEKDLNESNTKLRDLKVGNSFLMKELANANANANRYNLYNYNYAAPISPSNYYQNNL